jgi:vacuolar-type H+-ATPase subunit I/STV1
MSEKTQEGINLELENENKKYTLSISNKSNSLLINISENGNFLKNEFLKEFTLSDLAQSRTSKFFKLFDDINGVIISLQETFQNKKPLIKEYNDYIELKIIPILTAMGETVLIIPKKKEDDKEIIKNLCEIVKGLQAKVETLEEKMKKIEKTNFEFNFEI